MNIFNLKSYQHYSKKTIIDMAEHCHKYLYDTFIDKLYFHQHNQHSGWNRKHEEYEVLSPRTLTKIRRREVPLDDIERD